MVAAGPLIRKSPPTRFDTLGRPTRYAHIDTDEPGLTVKIGFEYDYDRVGNKKYQRSIHDAKDSQRYSYDSVGRLTSYIRGDFENTADGFCNPSTVEPWTGQIQSRKWDLDGVGNWTNTTTKVDDSTTSEQREDTTFNEYHKVGNTNQSHDDNGNLTDDGTQTYKWDGFNRLREVYDSQSNLLGKYSYNSGNRRILKDLSTSTLEYYYTAWQVAEERYTNATTPTQQYVYGIYIDEPLVMDVNLDDDSYTTSSQDTRYFYHQNSLYSVYALSNEANNLKEAYQYDPYGKHIQITDGDSDGVVEFDFTDARTSLTASTLGNPYLYTGREFDAETKLHNYRRRAYESLSGRFIARDPIFSSNLYFYVNNYPLLFLDPYGLSPEDESKDFKLNKEKIFIAQFLQSKYESLRSSAKKADYWKIDCEDRCQKFLGNIPKNCFEYKLKVRWKQGYALGVQVHAKADPKSVYDKERKKKKINWFDVGAGTVFGTLREDYKYEKCDPTVYCTCRRIDSKIAGRGLPYILRKFFLSPGARRWQVLKKPIEEGTSDFTWSDTDAYSWTDVPITPAGWYDKAKDALLDDLRDWANGD